RLDLPVRCANEVDVLGVTHRCGEVQLVQCCPAAKAKLPHQEVVVKQLNDCPTYDQVLLDLTLFGPRDEIAPGDDVLRGNQSSASCSRRSATFYRSFLSTMSGIIFSQAYLLG